MNSRAIFAVAALMLALPAAEAVGQEVRFQGKVVDTAGNPLSEVTVTLEDIQRGQSTTLTTNDEGSFFRRGMQLGVYRIRFEKEGFIPVVEERRLASGPNSLDVTMEPIPDAPALGPDSTPEYVAAFNAFQAGDYETVIQELEPLAEQNPDFINAFMLMARAHLELRQWDGAIAAYRRVVELNPDLAGAHLDLGVALVESGDPEAATPHFEAALALQPDNAETHYNIGVVYFRANEVESARSHLEQAVTIDPGHALAHKALAFALARVEDPEGAILHLERYLELMPEAPDAEAMRQMIEELRGSR